MFISSWVLPPGVGQYPSHVASALFITGRGTLQKPQLRNKNSCLILAGSILTNRSLYLAHDLVVGNCFPTLIIRNDLRLLVNFLRKRFDIKNESF